MAMERKKTKLDKAARKVAAILRDHLEALPPAEAKDLYNATADAKSGVLPWLKMCLLVKEQLTPVAPRVGFTRGSLKFQSNRSF
jgi:hypothetical protein